MTKILIADDQQLIRESLKIILDTDKDFDVIDVVGNGKDALESIEANKPDVVLMCVCHRWMEWNVRELSNKSIRKSVLLY